MFKTIVVIGVTGGSSVADAFLHLTQWRVRGITRNPSSPAAQALTAKGVEIVKGDLDDKQTLFPAFDGATAIFSNTDFSGYLQAGLLSKDILQGRSPNKYAFDREVEQGINIAEAAALPNTLKTLERFIFSSLSDARKWSHGKYARVYHFDSKAEIIRTIQTRFSDLAARMSTVQIGSYVRNWQMLPPLVPQKQSDGSFLVQRTSAPEYKVPFAVAHADTGSFVKALVDLPPGKNLLGVSESMSWPEWTRLWGDVLGVKATFKQVSADDFFRDVPGPLRDDLAEGFAYVEEFGHTGGDPEVMTTEQLGIDVPLTSMEEYIRSENWSSVL
ncbi:MAG: hypothetical protein M1821_009702 [Bathelium mastoideum]|nr:MAG: hypothetical protein M1821_009702 [Bathelium mastoideum]